MLSVSTVVETDTPLRELDQAFELLDDTGIVRSGSDAGCGGTRSVHE